MTRLTCRDCGDLLTSDNRTMKETNKNGKVYWMNRCKPCIVEADTLLRRLKKENPMPPSGTPCACCGRIDKLYCDHDHGPTKHFRGWVCRNCNSGLGLLSDSEEGLRRALRYLERSRPKERSRSPPENKIHESDETDRSVSVASGRADNIVEGSEIMHANS